MNAARPAVVTVIGSECTGKTTLAADLAHHFGTIWVPEFARIYADRRRGTTGEPLDETDVEPIARGQIAAEDEAIERATSLVILDTDLTSTVAYANHYYGACPAWVERAARRRRADLYLLTDIDVPWIADGVRDRPDVRDEMHALFTRTIEALGGQSVPIRGAWDERRRAATSAIEMLLRERNQPPSASSSSVTKE